MNPAAKVQHRPAEAGGISVATVLIIARAFGVKDPDILAGIGAAAGALPAAITWIVALTRGH